MVKLIILYLFNGILLVIKNKVYKDYVGIWKNVYNILWIKCVKFKILYIYL